ncbi:MAG TPA: hypothetical protein VI356_09740 [Myxococcales bacterium]
MRFDRHGQGWQPAHDREVRLRSSLGLVLGLVLMVVSAGALLVMPDDGRPPRAAVAATMP